jgi:hypothetical protein
MINAGQGIEIIEKKESDYERNVRLNREFADRIR